MFLITPFDVDYGIKVQTEFNTPSPFTMAEDFKPKDEFIQIVDLPDPVGEESTGLSLYIIEDNTNNEDALKFNFYPSTRMKGTVVCRAD
jgi:hypothetical protein